jgi:hypothetical protein
MLLTGAGTYNPSKKADSLSYAYPADLQSATWWPMQSDVTQIIGQLTNMHNIARLIREVDWGARRREGGRR